MSRREMEKNKELEEGEIKEDLDIDLSYIDEKITKVLGKFQKEWIERFRVNNMGTKFDKYGSFLVVHQQPPSNVSQFSGRSAPQKILKVYTSKELLMEIFQFYTKDDNYPPLSPLPKSVLRLAEKVIKPKVCCNIAHNVKRPSKSSQTSQKQKEKLSSVGFLKEYPIDGRVTRRNEQMKNMHSKDDHRNNNSTIIVDREQLPDSTGFAKHEEANGNASDGYDLWVACDRCNKWRLLPYGTDSKELPEKWRCSMQKWLPAGMNRCHISEEVTTNTFYERYPNEGQSFDKNCKAKSNRIKEGIHSR